MKKITLLFLSLVAGMTTYAQNTCATSLPISTTTVNSVGTIDGTMISQNCANTSTALGTAAEWYNFTAPATGVLNLNSDLAANAGRDTRVQVYSGACTALVCVGGGDDVSASNYLTNVNVNVTAGTVYTIAWDNRWESNAFVFNATFTAVSSPPNPVTTPTPADNATNVPVDPTDVDANGTPDNFVALSWSNAASGPPATSYEIYFGTDANALPRLGATQTFTSTSIRITGLTVNTTYFWRIVAVNGAGSAVGSSTWQFTTGALASVNDEAISFFTLSPNPTNDVLNINSKVKVEKFTIYNALGQVVSTNEDIINNSINVSNLKSGIYLISVENNNQVQTQRFIKN